MRIYFIPTHFINTNNHWLILFTGRLIAIDVSFLPVYKLDLGFQSSQDLSSSYLQGMCPLLGLFLLYHLCLDSFVSPVTKETPQFYLCCYILAGQYPNLLSPFIGFFPVLGWLIGCPLPSMFVVHLSIALTVLCPLSFFFLSLNKNLLAFHSL